MATGSDELRHVAKRLAAAADKDDEDKCLEYLKRLKGMKVKREDIEDTSVNKIVKKLRKHDDPLVSGPAESLYKEWKHLDGGKKAHKRSKSPPSGTFDPFACIDEAPSSPPPRKTLKTNSGAKASSHTDKPREPSSPPRKTKHLSAFDIFEEGQKKPPRSPAAPSPSRPAQRPTTTGTPNLAKGPQQGRPMGASKDAYNQPILEMQRQQAIQATKELRSKAYGQNMTNPKVLYDYKLTSSKKFVAVEKVHVDTDPTAKRSDDSVRKVKKVYSLTDLCLRMAENHIDYVGDLGMLPIHLLTNLLRRATPAQLERIEKLNPYLLDDSDVFWERHCNKNLYHGPEPPSGGWRTLYKKQQKAEKMKLRHIANGLKERYRAEQEEKEKKAVAFFNPTGDWLKHHKVVGQARNTKHAVQMRGAPIQKQPIGNMSAIQRLRQNMKSKSSFRR